MLFSTPHPLPCRAMFCFSSMDGGAKCTYVLLRAMRQTWRAKKTARELETRNSTLRDSRLCMEEYCFCFALLLYFSNDKEISFNLKQLISMQEIHGKSVLTIVLSAFAALTNWVVHRPFEFLWIRVS